MIADIQGRWYMRCSAEPRVHVLNELGNEAQFGSSMLLDSLLLILCWYSLAMSVPIKMLPHSQYTNICLLSYMGQQLHTKSLQTRLSQNQVPEPV